MEGWIDIRKQTKEQKINDKFVFKNVRWRKGQKDTTQLCLKFQKEKRTEGHNSSVSAVSVKEKRTEGQNSIVSEVPDGEKGRWTELNCVRSSRRRKGEKNTTQLCLKFQM